MPNSIADNLQRLVNARSAIADAITEKGGTVESGDGFEKFAADIATIVGGGDTPEFFDVTPAENVTVHGKPVKTGTKVTWTGRASFSSNVSGDKLVFTLPPEIRPFTKYLFKCGNGGYGYDYAGYILPNGEVHIVFGNSSSIAQGVFSWDVIEPDYQVSVDTTKVTSSSGGIAVIDNMAIMQVSLTLGNFSTGWQNALLTVPSDVPIPSTQCPFCVYRGRNTAQYPDATLGTDGVFNVFLDRSLGTVVDVICVWDINHPHWGEIREDVRSGAAQTKFPVGTIFYDNEDETTGTAFQVVGYDKHFDPEMTARGYTHSMTLCELKLTDLVTFDATEALLYVETAIAPGTYKFKIPNYDATYGGNKSYYFTTTKSIPIGGQITINWPYQQTPKTASTYSEIAGVTAIESGLTLSEWVEGDSPAAIDLGTAAGPNAELGTSSFGKMNHIHRARYGSNNYLQSGIRQYINSDKAASLWWSPQTVFDRPYGSRTSAGMLTKLSSEFVDVLVKPTIKSRTNDYFEADSLDGTTFSVSTEYTITTDKMFLLSPNEVGLNADTTIGATLDYYLNATNADRIKHRASNDAAYYWWLRTPYPTYAYHVRYVYTSGALNHYSAYNTSGVAAACVIQ